MTHFPGMFDNESSDLLSEVRSRCSQVVCRLTGFYFAFVVHNETGKTTIFPSLVPQLHPKG